jgi:gamma-glutamyltranspeptidase/glutathione hydrolase
MFTTRPELLGTYGMVASTHWLASAVGMRVLELGGNAFDAAVAAGFVLQVVEPHSNGPGGEVPIILATADHDVFVVNGQGPAPAAASAEYFRGLGLDLIPGDGLLPACVPGAFDAWMLLLAEFGTKTLGEILAPTVAYAERGYPVLPQLCAAIAGRARLFRAEWPSSASVWLRGGEAPTPGTLWRNPDLAATYRRVLADAEAAGGSRERQIEAARRAWYRGFVAEAITRFVDTAEVMDSSGARHRALLTGDDLARYQARLEPPVTFDYHGYTVCKTNSWGQGPVFLQQLALLSGFDLRSMEPASADFVHTVVECAKLAFADREAWYGDPDHVDVPLEGLLDQTYANERRALVGERASFGPRPGSVYGREPPPLPSPVENGGWGDLTVPPTGDTVHLDVIDRWGNIVSATPSGGWLQSSPTVPGLGFCLGTRGQMFWLNPRHPNAVAGGKRPRTTLSPSLALRDGEPYLAFGTPGGDTQDQWTLSFFLRHVHFGSNLQAAIDAPLFHTEAFPSSFHPRRANPGSVIVEGRFPHGVVDALRARGHDVTVREPWSLGRITAVGRDPVTGVLKAAADPRGMHGYAVGR